MCWDLFYELACGQSWRMSYVLEEKKICMYSAVVARNFLKMSVKSSCLIVLFNSSVCLCLVFLSIIESWVLKSPIFIVELFTTPFNSVCFSYMYFGDSIVRGISVMLGAYMFIIVLFLVNWPLYQYKVFFVVSSNIC